jgi:hypothetical protein
METVHKCANCGIAASYRCSVCHSAEYCCKECQVVDWMAGHSIECVDMVGQRIFMLTEDEATSASPLSGTEFIRVTSGHPKNYMWFGSIPLRMVEFGGGMRGRFDPNQALLSVREGYVDRHKIRRNDGIFFLHRSGESRTDALRRFAAVLKLHGDAISKRYYQAIGRIRPEPKR